ncbi:VOC family protein [Cohnella sp. 56]|uniref:VOC family protein n=1 Tax=Cohnella sp. 56 TaxID=3113722 RepID=UPI0030E7B585
MITHIVSLELRTSSVQGCKQFYRDQLGFAVIGETADEIRFAPTPRVSLIFRESDEAPAHAHVAFEVPHSAFGEIVRELERRRIAPLQWADGRIVDEFESGTNVYFRDCDGNLLEFIAHPGITEGVVEPSGPFRILYVREIGLPVDDVLAFRALMVDLLSLRLAKAADDFAFAIGGTAHLVVASKRRRWIPIAMRAVPPSLKVVLGASDARTIEGLKERLAMKGMEFGEREGVVFEVEGYEFAVRLDARFADVPARLGLNG